MNEIDNSAMRFAFRRTDGSPTTQFRGRSDVLELGRRVAEQATEVKFSGGAVGGLTQGGSHYLSALTLD